MRKLVTIVFLLISSIFLMVACGARRENPLYLSNTQSEIIPSQDAHLSTVIPSLRNTPTNEQLSNRELTETAYAPTSDALMATQRAYWDNLGTWRKSRGAVCPDGYAVEMPVYIADMSNDQWTIFTCSPVPNNPKDRWTPGVVDYGNRFTSVLKTDFSQRWTISHKDFTWSNRPDALLSTYKWTSDGKYVYLREYIYPCCDGPTPPYFFTSDNVLYRLNLITGEFETVLLYREYGYAYLLSPNGQYLAFSYPDEQKIIHIRDLKNNTEMKIKLEGDYVLSGAFAWSLDNTKLFFASCLSGWEEGTAGISIFVLTVKYMYLQTILYNDKRLLIPYPKWDGKETHYWMDNNLLYLMSLNFGNPGGFVINTRSGHVIDFGTPTPWPTYTSTPRP